MTHRSRDIAAWWWVVALAVAAGASVRAAEADAPKAATDEQWYVVRFQGKHSGHLRMWTSEADGRITTGSAMHLAMRRGPATIEVDIDGTFVETADGKPIEATMSQKAATERMSRTVTFTDAGRRIVTVQGDREHVREAPPIEGDWLTPAAASRYASERAAAGDERITFRTLDLSMGDEPYEVTQRFVGREEIEVFGRVVTANKTVSSIALTGNIESTEYADDAGNLLRSTVDMGGLSIEIVAADKALATAGVDPPELMASTLVKPGFALRRPREIRKAEYLLSVPEGEMPALPMTPVQSVAVVDALTVRVTIDLDAKAEGGEKPAIEHTPMIDGRDEKIVELVKEATLNVGDDPARRAEAMRRFVRRYIRGASLDVGFASASETARARTGDCTEHGVLLAAMLKADGIPARAASGLIYVREFLDVKGVFGYHMWAQAWIDGRWIDLDGTLDEGAFDAAHILLGASNLADGAADNDMLTMIPLIGRLRIEWAN